jgi:hypothetical protein
MYFQNMYYTPFLISNSGADDISDVTYDKIKQKQCMICLGYVMLGFNIK